MRKRKARRETRRRKKSRQVPQYQPNGFEALAAMVGIVGVGALLLNALRPSKKIAILE